MGKKKSTIPNVFSFLRKIRSSKIFIFILLLQFSYVTLAQKSPADYVNMFTGTSNSRWMLGPYAGVPYGMIQLGPDNQESGWMAGYEYSIMNVTGFSHIHAWTMAGLMIMPQTQDFTKESGASSKAYRGAGAGFHSRILKETEIASPGYYSCELYDANCKAELTASTHCGFHKYTFNKDIEDARILLVLKFPYEYKFDIEDAVIETKSENSIEGYALTRAESSGVYKLHFVIQFNKPFTSFNGWENEIFTNKGSEISGKGDLGAFVNYKVKAGESIMVKVGLSLVDLEGARKNLKSELDPFDWNFEAAVSSARQSWNNLLSTIEVNGSEENKEKFYTNFYRSFAKQTWSDVDGRYVDPFNRIQQLPVGGVMYGGDAFWNTFWNFNTILSLVAPDIMSNWVTTQLELFDKTGWTNNGPTGIKLTGIMEVTHEIALMVSAYQKGIRNYDVNKLYQAVRHNGMEQGKRLPGNGLSGMERLDIYNKLGYVPLELDAASRTLDYSYTDFCAAQLAKVMNKTADYDFFLKRSENWKNQFHPELKWQIPKDKSGNWMKDWDLFSGKHWIEGNSWQYTWYVPHDVTGLVNSMGKELFNKRLEEGFEKSYKNNFAAHAFDRHQDIAYEYYVNHGNEGNMQASFLFNYSGKPWLTQKYSRAILDKYYGNTPYHGWEGDEDEGQMGGWFVIASMGLFEMNGGVTNEPTFDLTSPLFDEIIIHTDKMYNGGKPFVIRTINNSAVNIYIQSATLNGNTINKPSLKFKDVVKGGELVFIMGETPNYKWGI
jgi:predicted alpha-1,2-mannosidase